MLQREFDRFIRGLKEAGKQEAVEALTQFQASVANLMSLGYVREKSVPASIIMEDRTHAEGLQHFMEIPGPDMRNLPRPDFDPERIVLSHSEAKRRISFEYHGVKKDADGTWLTVVSYKSKDQVYGRVEIPLKLFNPVHFVIIISEGLKHPIEILLSFGRD